MISVIPGINVTSSALQAERIRMEVIGSNIANANVTRGPDGLPYQRQQVTFESVMNHASSIGGGNQFPEVSIAGVQADNRAPKMVYDPGHPEADADTGMRLMPNINVHEEMADYMIASRAYEANLAVVKTARSIAMQTLSIGKR